jgi:hypothetical protein
MMQDIKPVVTTHLGGHTANAYWEDNTLDKLSSWISVLDSVLKAHIEGSPLPKEARYLK